MKIFQFKVDGASPGDNGVIVVVARARGVANVKANRQLREMNITRTERGQNPVTIDFENCGVGVEFTGEGVVYSCDGEG